MTLYDLALMVRAMRKAQATYFGNRNARNLDAAKWSERAVDAAVKDAIKAGQTTPPLPFDAPAANGGAA